MLYSSIDQRGNKKKDYMRLVPLHICGMNAAAPAAAPPVPVWLAVLGTNRSFEKTNAEWFGL